MRKFLFAVSLLALPILAIANTALKPEHASYTVSRDGKAIGEASYSLAHNPDDSWTLHSETRGTRGMAKFLGLDVREESTFTSHAGKLQGVRYNYEQDAAIKHKRRHIDFDWMARHAQVHDNGKHFDYAIPPGTIDRGAVAVALGLALANGAKSMELPVAVKDRVESQQFALRGSAVLELPQGRFDSVEIDRTDAPGKVKSWYSTQFGVLPVRVEQKQHDGSVIVMEIGH